MKKIQKLLVVTLFSLSLIPMIHAEESYLATAEIPPKKIAKFDKDADGKLTGDELREFEKMIIGKGFDKDKDSKINEAEYKAWLDHAKSMSEGKEKPKKTE